MKKWWIVILALIIPTACTHGIAQDTRRVGIITRDSHPNVMESPVRSSPGSATGNRTVENTIASVKGDLILDKIITRTPRGTDPASATIDIIHGGTPGNTTTGIPSISPGGNIPGITGGVPTDSTMTGITSSFPAGGTTTGTTGTITLGGTATVNRVIPGGTTTDITSSFPAHGTTTGTTGNITLGGLATTSDLPPGSPIPPCLRVPASPHLRVPLFPKSPSTEGRL
ncbi:MAG TPA: hypothetical protein VNM22_09630 [Candidatus Limnocylindrales bacterium]|nr:hypothetical protein [Candidatus Limnocylindrales bacterium]